MAIELVPLCTMHLQARPPIEVGTGAAGTRIIFEIESVQVKGDRLRGEMLGAAAADWVVVGPEGTGTLDIRETLQTDDGDHLRAVPGQVGPVAGMQFPMTAYVAPRFETGDARYAWLNRIQAVGKGTLNEDLSVDYEWYEVR